MLFRDLNEAQILALASTAEEEDAYTYRDFAESLRKDFPATALERTSSVAFTTPASLMFKMVLSPDGFSEMTICFALPCLTALLMVARRL